ncbi:MAG TPA: citrate/2-methylcitrate synthase [Acidimicrobiia bacterium]|jgi:citrate synthase
MAMPVPTIDAPPGLEGVVVAETAIGDVRGDEGFYHYRGHPAPRLAESRAFEDVWHLLHVGDLPTRAEGDGFRRHVGSMRRLPADLVPLLRAAAVAGGDLPALVWLRSLVSLTAQHAGLTPWLGRDAEAVADEALHLVAAMPTLVGLGWRTRNGLAELDPDPGRGVAADLLAMLHGTEPHPIAVRALERYLVLTIDHGFNASTLAARVLTSTGADLGSGMVAAMGALSGPLHGGAPVHALRMLEAIGSPERAWPWIEGSLDRGERLMGFGHRVYRTEDPRSVVLRSVAEEFTDPIVALAIEVEGVALAALQRRHPQRPLRTNVEYYAGVVLHLCGIPSELFPAVFAVSRSVGWAAHMVEQASANRLIRPASRYVGTPRVGT